MLAGIQSFRQDEPRMMLQDLMIRNSQKHLPALHTASWDKRWNQTSSLYNNIQRISPERMSKNKDGSECHRLISSQAWNRRSHSEEKHRSTEKLCIYMVFTRISISKTPRIKLSKWHLMLFHKEVDTYLHSLRSRSSKLLEFIIQHKRGPNTRTSGELMHLRACRRSSTEMQPSLMP